MLSTRRRHIAAIIACLAVVSATFAVTMPQAGADTLPPAACHPQGGFTINYLNGIANTYSQAIKARQGLKNRYGVVRFDEPISYNSLYNDTHGMAADMMEVFDQKAREAVERGLLTAEDLNKIMSSIVGTGINVATAPSRAFAWLLTKVPIDAVKNAARSYGDFLNELPGWYEAANNAVTSWMTDQVRRFADLTLLDPETRAIIDDHATTLRSQIASGRKSLIVAHSQGNLFANPIYRKVKDVVSSDSLRVVHVAAPTLLTSGPYTTNDTDLVIGGLIALGQALPANAHLTAFSANYTNHDFVKAYIKPGTDPYTKVLANIDDQLDALVPAANSGSDGLFTVTLTWAGAGDVDLHVVEPGGQHVFYGSKAGTNGYLDVDNVVADGPEHYFAACDSAGLTGEFEVSVQNYAAPTNVATQVQLSSADRIFEPVPVSIGGATHSSATGTVAFRVQARMGSDGRVVISQL